MLLGYQLPQDWAYAGTAAWVNTSAPCLHNRDTSSPAIFTWPTGAQTLGTTVTIVATRAAGFAPRAAMMVGLSLPVGTKITVEGRAAAGHGVLALGGNSTTQRTALMPDGTVGIMWVFDAGLAAIDGYTITIYNDVNLAVLIPAGSIQSIKEANVCPAVYMPHTRGWLSGRNDPYTKIVRRRGGNVSVESLPSWRYVSMRIHHGNLAAFRQSGLDNGLDYEKVLAILAKDRFVLVFDDTSTPDLIQRSGLFGLCLKWPEITQTAGRVYQLGQFEFEEIPS